MLDRGSSRRRRGHGDRQRRGARSSSVPQLIERQFDRGGCARRSADQPGEQWRLGAGVVARSARRRRRSRLRATAARRRDRSRTPRGRHRRRDRRGSVHHRVAVRDRRPSRASARRLAARGSDRSSRQTGRGPWPAGLEHGPPGAGAHPGAEAVLGARRRVLGWKVRFTQDSGVDRTASAMRHDRGSRQRRGRARPTRQGYVPTRGCVATSRHCAARHGLDATRYRPVSSGCRNVLASAARAGAACPHLVDKRVDRGRVERGRRCR